MEKLYVHSQNRNLVVTATNKVVADTLSEDFTAEEQREHTECIVRACNSRDALVSALRNLYEAIDSCTDLTPEILQQASAALSLAKGE